MTRLLFYSVVSSVKQHIINIKGVCIYFPISWLFHLWAPAHQIIFIFFTPGSTQEMGNQPLMKRLPTYWVSPGCLFIFLLPVWSCFWGPWKWRTHEGPMFLPFLQLAENQLHHDQEKAGMLRDFHVEKEVWYSEKEQEVESLKETIRADMTTLEHRSREKQEKDVRVNICVFIWPSLMYWPIWCCRCTHLYASNIWSIPIVII